MLRDGGRRAGTEKVRKPTPLTIEPLPDCHTTETMPMNTKRISAALCLVLGFILSAPAQELPKHSRTEEAGFSSERLARITTFFRSEVERGAIPGAVIVVARRGKVVYRQAVGYQDREKKTAMKADAMFRIYSMTKPITATVVIGIMMRK